MLTVVAENGRVRVEDRPEPQPREGTARVTVTSSGICGSDLHLLSSGFGGVVLGHEFGGITDDGRLVAVRPTGECGACAECGRGLAHLCRDAGRSLLGVSRDGGLAEVVVVETDRLVEVPSSVDPLHVALVEPLAVVVHGIDRASPTPGSTALVMGAGSIGLLCAAALVDRGVDVEIVARHDHQQAAARSIGARVVSAPGRPADTTFDAVCSQASFDACVSATRPGGVLVEFGMFWEPVTLSNTMLMKEITVVPSIFYGHAHGGHDFATAAGVLSRQPRLADHLVTHRFGLSDAPEAFSCAGNRAAGAIKVHLFTRV